MADIPLLRTERLVVRAHRLGDFEAIAAMYAEPDTVRFIGAGEPHSREVVWSRLQRAAGAWPMLGYGFLAIEHAASGRVIGEAGFLERFAPTGERRTPEAGWALAASARGRGYAGEAMAAILAWGDQRFERTICVIAKENAPSIALAHRLGYRDHGVEPPPPDWTGPEFLRFERERPAPAR
jgi:RimJ/RimL family protein N-acetyltransferase